MDGEEEDRDELAHGLESSVQEIIERDLENSGTMVTGWVLVAEFIDSEGKRSLITTTGGNHIPEWQRDGYLVSALKGGWDET